MEKIMKSRKTIILLIATVILTFSGCRTTPEISISSVSDAYINDAGELVFVYSDGKEENLGTVVGRDGADGKDGRDGKDGADGINGEDGSVTITQTGSNIAEATSKGLRSSVSIICKFSGATKTPSGETYRGSSGTQDYYSAGAGVIYTIDKAEGDAFIITNHHVVHDSESTTDDGISDEITVYLYGGEIAGRGISAEYIGGSAYYDIALLRIEDSEVLKASCALAATVADSDKTVVGEPAIAIGNPNGDGTSVSYGVVSVDSEYIDITAEDGSATVSFRVMRVDTAVNSGNSGGGLYNESGELMGIVNAKIMDSSVENIGYAIPSNVAVAVANNIIDNCYGTDLKSVQRGMLGVTVQVIDSCAEYESDTGRLYICETVQIQEVFSDGVANGKLKSGDIIKEISLSGKAKEVIRQYQLIDFMLDVRVGDIITLSVLRAGEEISVDITMTKNSITAY